MYRTNDILSRSISGTSGHSSRVRLSIGLATVLPVATLAAIFFGAVWLMLCLVGGKSLGKDRRHFADPLPVSPEVVPVPIDQSAQTIKVHRAS
jgi:hypothetical protein